MNKESFRPAYFPPDHGVWSKRGLPSCQRLAEAILKGEGYFRWLDVPQLLKHAVGLATALRVRFTLHYIYFDSPGTEGAGHAREIEGFTALVGEEIRFVPRSYQNFFRNLILNIGIDHSQYVSYLQERYFDA